MSSPGVNEPSAPDPLATVKLVARKGWRYAAAVVVVLVAAGVVFGHRLHWGDFPTWLVAVTTLLAFLAAAVASLVAFELLRIEQERDRLGTVERRYIEAQRAEQREADRRGQASKVAGWYGTWRLTPPVHGGTDNPPERPKAGAIIRNTSDLPVYDMRVSFCVPVDPSAGLTWRQGERYITANGQLRIVPPGESWIEIPPEIKAQELQAAQGDKPEWLIAIEFTDANRVRWVRDPYGRLGPA